MKFANRFFLISAAFIGLLFITQSSAAQIEVENAWTRATAPNAKTGAAYMVLKNNGSTDDKLIGAESDVAKKTQIHTAEMKDGMMNMHRVEFILVPGGGSAELKPGGYHVMMMGLKQPLKEGREVHITLKFENAGEIKVTAPVKKAGKNMKGM